MSLSYFVCKGLDNSVDLNQNSDYLFERKDLPLRYMRFD